MSWSEVIHAIIAANGGHATLPMLYQQAGQYRELPTGAFRSYEQVARFYFSCVEHYELRPAFWESGEMV